MDYRGLLYRAVNARCPFPLSGTGAAIYGGRFNPQGVPALYTSFREHTILLEASQYGRLQPTLVVAIEAEVERIADCDDTALLQRFGVTLQDIGAPDWRAQIRQARQPPGQRLAQGLIAEGFTGLRVHSFARGARSGDVNLVLWAWGTAPPSRLVVIDDEDRLDGARAAAVAADLKGGTT